MARVVTSEQTVFPLLPFPASMSSHVLKSHHVVQATAAHVSAIFKAAVSAATPKPADVTANATSIAANVTRTAAGKTPSCRIIRSHRPSIQQECTYTFLQTCQIKRTIDLSRHSCWPINTTSVIRAQDLSILHLKHRQEQHCTNRCLGCLTIHASLHEHLSWDPSKRELNIL